MDLHTSVIKETVTHTRIVRLNQATGLYNKYTLVPIPSPSPQDEHVA